jgi:CxxC motif-containing protein
MSKKESKTLTCINCPLGCAVTVTMADGEIEDIVGNSCKRGEIYARKEVTAPTRIVTSVVRVNHGEIPMVSVKTQRDIPKEKIFDCMQVIQRIHIEAPVTIGDIIAPNVCDTGVDIVATKNIKKM